MATVPADLAIWTITPNGLNLAARVRTARPEADLFHSLRLHAKQNGGQSFERLAPAVARQFNRYAGHIFIMSTGIVVRTIAPLLRHKTKDPAVVVMDDQGQYAISLVAGHIGGANRLAHEVAALLKATPVITTATDVNRKPAIDMLAVKHNLAIENPDAIKRVNMALLTGEPVMLHDPAGWLGNALPNIDAISWPADKQKSAMDDPGRAIVFIDDRVGDQPPHALVLRPASLVAGIGCNRNTPKQEIRALLYETLNKFGLARQSLGAIATITLKSDETGLCALAAELNLPLQLFSKAELNRVKEVPNPSDQVAKHVGVSSVCEAAAILASGNGPLIKGKEIISTGMTKEVRRVSAALAEAHKGKRVALISSGDPGIYAMAGLALEMCAGRGLKVVPSSVMRREQDPPNQGLCIEVVPGIPALCAGAALLGAPLTHDFAAISLSDLLTPWKVIEKRIDGAARADFVIVIYNPKSKKRNWQLQRAQELILKHRNGQTPAGIVTSAMRPDQQIRITILEQVHKAEVNMQTAVFIGNSTTTSFGEFMYTPRGYGKKYEME